MDVMVNAFEGQKFAKKNGKIYNFNQIYIVVSTVVSSFLFFESLVAEAPRQDGVSAVHGGHRPRGHDPRRPDGLLRHQARHLLQVPATGAALALLVTEIRVLCKAVIKLA